jgi:flagellar biogenesis protein FliO
VTRTLVRAVAITLALAATVLTSQANAQQDPPRDTSPAPADPATPLALRPTKRLELAQEPPHSGVGWKIVAVIAILGGAAFALRKRIQPKRPEDGQLTIVRRAAIGFRSELLIVNVEGQRLLIGVTPHSIQSLAVLDTDEVAVPTAVAGLEAATPQPPASVGERFAAMLSAADGRAPGPGAHPVTHPATPADESLLASQARGLIGLRRRG